MKNLFTNHPRSVGETYFQHFYHASRFGMGMIIGGTACCLHAVFPFVFKKTGSDYLLRLTREFIDRVPVVEERIVLLRIAINSKMGETERYERNFERETDEVV